jgi:hypothetical protein
MANKNVSGNPKSATIAGAVLAPVLSAPVTTAARPQAKNVTAIPSESTAVTCWPRAVACG